MILTIVERGIGGCRLIREKWLWLIWGGSCFVMLAFCTELAKLVKCYNYVFALLVVYTLQ